MSRTAGLWLLLFALAPFQYTASFGMPPTGGGHQAFNAGHWHGLEDFCSIWANIHGRVWVTYGPVFDDRVPTQTIGDGSEVRGGVPEQFFKIVIRENPDEPGLPLTLPFHYPHSASLIDDRNLDVDHTPFLRCVDEIEVITELDFLANLEESVESELESARTETVSSLGIEYLLVHRMFYETCLDGGVGDPS